MEDPILVEPFSVEVLGGFTKNGYTALKVGTHKKDLMPDYDEHLRVCLRSNFPFDTHLSLWIPAAEHHLELYRGRKENQKVTVHGNISYSVEPVRLVTGEREIIGLEGEVAREWETHKEGMKTISVDFSGDYASPDFKPQNILINNSWPVVRLLKYHDARVYLSGPLRVEVKDKK
jgi:hypothetical protein